MTETTRPGVTGTAELQGAFREVMAGVCTPVSVVTALADGLPHGTTVSAFASLSMSPPMVLVSLDRGSVLLARVRETRRFGLNVLASGQADLALRFAGKGEDRFAGVGWTSRHEVPCLDGSGGFLACDVAEIVEGGDHLVLLGEVRCAEVFTGSPLTYYGRTFGTHSSLDDASG